MALATAGRRSMPRIAECLIAFVVAYGLSARADTLALRNGTTVTGSWAGADAQQICFLVQDQIQPYPRSEVSAVTFGDEQPKSQTPAARISIGMGMDEVMAALGQADKVADMGQRKIYFYKDLKVTFADGKVCEISSVAASSADRTTPGNLYHSCELRARSKLPRSLASHWRNQVWYIRLRPRPCASRAARSCSLL